MTPYILTPHHTEARVYHRYDDALSAARGLGITAAPQFCLAREGWTVVVEWEGEPYYHKAVA